MLSTTVHEPIFPLQVHEIVSHTNLMLAATSADVKCNSLALDANTVLLNAHAEQLGAIHTDIQENLTITRTVCAASSPSRFDNPTNVSFDCKPSDEADVFTVVRDAMVILQRFTQEQVTGEVRVPLACSVIFAMAMSPDLPIVFRMMLANMISFFMWKQVMMPLSVRITVTIFVWPQAPVQVSLSTFLGMGVCWSSMYCCLNLTHHDSSRIGLRCSRYSAIPTP